MILLSPSLPPLPSLPSYSHVCMTDSKKAVLRRKSEQSVSVAHTMPNASFDRPNSYVVSINPEPYSAQSNPEHRFPLKATQKSCLDGCCVKEDPQLLRSLLPDPKSGSGIFLSFRALITSSAHISM